MARKVKVPKQIAGVKVPKALRRGLKDLARSQNGRTVLTEALVAAAGVLAAHEAQPGSHARGFVDAKAPGAKAKAKALGEEARSWGASAGAFTDAARAFTETLRRSAGSPGAEPEARTPPGAQH